MKCPKNSLSSASTSCALNPQAYLGKGMEMPKGKGAEMQMGKPLEMPKGKGLEMKGKGEFAGSTPGAMAMPMKGAGREQAFYDSISTNCQVLDKRFSEMQLLTVSVREFKHLKTSLDNSAVLSSEVVERLAVVDVLASIPSTSDSGSGAAERTPHA